MPEQKFLEPQPCKFGMVTDFRGRPFYGLEKLRGRKIKWARRDGAQVKVMVDAGHGLRGLLVVFPTVEDYEQSVRRVLESNAAQTTEQVALV
jgi:hypothetical protein